MTLVCRRFRKRKLQTMVLPAELNVKSSPSGHCHSPAKLRWAGFVGGRCAITAFTATRRQVRAAEALHTCPLLPSYWRLWKREPLEVGLWVHPPWRVVTVYGAVVKWLLSAPRLRRLVSVEGSNAQVADDSRMQLRGESEEQERHWITSTRPSQRAIRKTREMGGNGHNEDNSIYVQAKLYTQMRNIQH